PPAPLSLHAALPISHGTPEVTVEGGNFRQPHANPHHGAFHRRCSTSHRWRTPPFRGAPSGTARHQHPTPDLRPLPARTLRNASPRTLRAAGIRGHRPALT